MDNKIYGYCRISTAKQSIDRQITNITRAYPTAMIIQETYTGTKSNRPEWTKLLKKLNTGDTVVFDSVSRMSRNAAEGFDTYMELYNKGINLVFLKEQTINTDSFKSVLGDNKLSVRVNTNDDDTDRLINGIMSEVAIYITKLAEKQIRLAFEQSEKEVQDLHKRTSEGIREAKKQGKQIGRTEGQKIVTKKSTAVKEMIVKYHKAFGKGTLNDIDTMAMINGQGVGVARNSYYKYKSELFAEYGIE
ncbi:Site-specific DNA recombinase [Ruminococcus sp. YE71]|uniref:recombinase family protein n=1 Tax=unclassified Ruminococcus TaxID=2608920 RepID=UPI0008814F1D|nr:MULTISPECIES: recombinase family protein [unclassified Ruminococcus]SDA29292.1 Site-specific DNA recombinase [Ruminococcus sp. YE78]SFW47935.1 Site-specific DNA recombinase [Ruminococcus sp. YE71]